MRIFYVLFVLFTMLCLNCLPTSNQIMKPKIVEKNKPKTEEIKKPSNGYNNKNCKLKPLNPNDTSNKRYHYGTGWDIILPEGWKITPNKDTEIYSVFDQDGIYVIGSITVVDYNKNCLTSFAKQGLDILSNKDGIEVLDTIIVTIGGAKNVVALFIHTDNVIGLQAFTTFNKKGYITTCIGDFVSQEDAKNVLNKCSDFSNEIKFQQ